MRGNFIVLPGLTAPSGAGGGWVGRSPTPQDEMLKALKTLIFPGAETFGGGKGGFLKARFSVESPMKLRKNFSVCKTTHPYPP